MNSNSNDTLYGFRSEEDESIYTCSLHSTRASTNATADDLPGPGRNLGRLYNYLGKKVEVQIGKVAEKMGKGPRMTAVRIQRVRSKTTKRIWPRCKNYDARCTQIERDCEKLIRYTGSDIVSTKLEALDQITRLAIEDDDVRNLLLVKGAMMAIEPLKKWNPAWIDIRPTLLPRCRKALISLGDTEIRTLVVKFERSKCIFMFRDGRIFDRIRTCIIDALAHFLSCPDQAFLVVRHAAHVMNKSYTHGRGIMECFREISPDAMIEWDLLDDLLYKHFKRGILDRHNHPYDSLTVSFRLADRLPKTIREPLSRHLASFDTVDLKHTQITYRILERIANTNGIDDATQVDFGFLKRLYPHPDVDGILRRISCPPDVLLCKILDSIYPSGVRGMPRIEPQSLSNIFPRLAVYVDSEDELIRQRALRAFEFLLSNDIYSREAGVDALSSTRFGGSADFQRMVQSSELNRLPHGGGYSCAFYRHCDADGHLLHLGYCTQSYNLCQGVGGPIQYLHAPDRNLVSIRISHGTAFSASAHYPILAGMTTTGKKAYVAYAWSKDVHDSNFVAITDGTRPEDIRVKDDYTKGSFTPEYVDVYALRYEPDVYMRSGLYSNDDEIGDDPTGPFSWKPRDLPMWLYAHDSDESDEHDADSMEGDNEGENEMGSEEDSVQFDEGDENSTEDGWDSDKAEETRTSNSSVDTLDTPEN